MRVGVFVKATKSSEAGELPSKELLENMTKFNEELVKAGILVAGDGFKPSSQGVRVRFNGPERNIIKGPFKHTEELVAGYWIWNVASMEDAIRWVMRCPNPMPEVSDIEIRPIYEFEDFGENLTPELREREEKIFSKPG